MQHIDVTRKRPARWPWLFGAGVLVVVVWGVTVLLRPPALDQEPDDVITAADTLPPSLIPSASTQGSVPNLDPEAGEVGALTEDRVGERIRVEGEVLATDAGGLWILTLSRVLRVDSHLQARTGDTLSVEGVLRAVDPDATDRPLPGGLSGHPESGDWTVLRSVRLVDEPATATAPGTGG